MTVPVGRLRLRREDGFTLVELVIAMVVLSIAILALIAAYTSGFMTLNRATRVSSARLVVIAKTPPLEAA